MKPLVSFGLITDLQYGDIPDRQNYQKTAWRRYRNALKCIREAVSHWQMRSPKLSFVIQVGDIIDGFNATSPVANASAKALELILDEFNRLPTRTVHVLGNHELYNFSRDELARSQLHPSYFFRTRNTSISQGAKTTKVGGDPEKFYFSFSPHAGYRIVVLDSLDVSILGRDTTSSRYKEAYKILTSHNRNTNLESSAGLQGREKRFVSYNGGLGKEQLEWLKDTLSDAEKHNQRVLIFSHIPICPELDERFDSVWNYSEVLDLIWGFKCVVACLHGHEHEDAHFVDHRGIHHCVYAAVVEAPSGSNAFATIHLSEDGITVEGQGTIASRVLKFNN